MFKQTTTHLSRSDVGRPKRCGRVPRHTLRHLPTHVRGDLEVLGVRSLVRELAPMHGRSNAITGFERRHLGTGGDDGTAEVEAEYGAREPGALYIEVFKVGGVLRHQRSERLRCEASRCQHLQARTDAAYSTLTRTSSGAI
jgi:hypothetical protein